jgi:hypothetical protein
MAYQSTFDQPGKDTNAFYRRTLHVLSDARVPFLVGGSHAILNYTGIVRETKDFDVFIRRDDLEAALQSLREAGYHTEITFPHWLAKARQGNDVVDLVFSSGNGICRVDDEWFAHAFEADVLGMPVKIAPVEELLWQKAYVMERERYDGADVAHILRTCAESLDWDRVLQRFDPHWQVASLVPGSVRLHLSIGAAPHSGARDDRAPESLAAGAEQSAERRPRLSWNAYVARPVPAGHWPIRL